MGRFSFSRSMRLQYLEAYFHFGPFLIVAEVMLPLARLAIASKHLDSHEHIYDVGLRGKETSIENKWLS